jgi:hypothetical protein
MGAGVAVAGKETGLTSGAASQRASGLIGADEAAPPSREERRESECMRASGVRRR